MAFAGVFRAFFSLVAVILILLCAFAGSHRYFFATADIVKIHLPDPTGGNMPQHLSIHVMSICRGTKNNITDCTSLRVPVHFLQTSVLSNTQGVLLVEYTISRLAALARTSRLLSMFYVIAIGASGLSSLYWITSFRRRNLGWHLHAAPKHALASNPDLPPSLVEFLSLATSTFSMYIASTIASIISEEFVYLINTDGNPYGVSASHGDYFLKLSWTATTIQYLVVIESFISILKPRIGYLLCDETGSH